MEKKGEVYKATTTLRNECPITCEFEIRVSKGVKFACISDKLSTGDGRYSLATKESMSISLESSGEESEMVVVFRNGCGQTFNF